AEWESERNLELARVMVNGIRDYLRQFEASGGELFAQEAGFGVQIDRALLRGKVDRLELVATTERREAISILDLKTGKNTPTKVELTQHAQLQAYQLGLLEGTFTLPLDADQPAAAVPAATVPAATTEPDSAEVGVDVSASVRALGDDYGNAGA